MSTVDEGSERRLRAAAFAFLDRLAGDGRLLVRQEDLADFSFEGHPVRLMVTQQGIWKPRQLDAAWSFRTVSTSDPSRRPDDDDPGEDGSLAVQMARSGPAAP